MSDKQMGIKGGAGQSFPDLSPSQIFTRSKSSVVVIVASNQQEQAQGSGFIVADDTIVTNHHVVEGMKQAFVVFSDGKAEPVMEVIADSPEQDLIILRVQTDRRRALFLGDELSLKEGDPVYALGAPKGLELSFTNGIVSSFRKSASQFLIQTTAPIAPGSSGGPLLDKSGSVVGVTTSRITDAPGIYFSVGSGDIRRLMRTPFAVTVPFIDWTTQEEPTKPTDSNSTNHSSVTEGSPTLEETFAWMLDFVKRYSRVTGTVSTGQYFESFERVHECDVKIAHYTFGPANSPIGTVETFRLRDVDPERIYVSNSADVNLFTIRNEPLIHRIGTLSGSSQQISTDHVLFYSKDDAERFAKAIKHAVTLCQSVKEPF